MGTLRRTGRITDLTGLILNLRTDANPLECSRNARLVLSNVKLILIGMGHGGSGFDPATQSADRMPYALSFATGLAVFSYWRLSGGMQILGF